MALELNRVVQLVLNGLVIGNVYILVALGLTLMFGLTRLVFFAQGAVLTLAALLVWGAVAAGVPYLMAILVAVAVILSMGFPVERGPFTWIRDEPIKGFILSLGLIMILENAMVLAWTGQPKSLPPTFPGIWQVGDIRVGRQAVLALATTAVIAASLLLILHRTRWGKGLRAYAEDAEAAALMGVPVRLILSVTFLVSLAIAAIGGALWITLFPVTPFTGSTVIIKAFAVTIVGGLGSVSGAILAGVALGIVESFTAFYWPDWTDGVAFVAIITMVLLRPSGLMRGVQGADIS